MGDPQVQANDELEIAEAQNSLCDLLYDVVARTTTTRIGGFVCRQMDRLMSTVEKTAKWSLPQPPPGSANDDDDNEDGKMNISPPPLVRPLPWILFLPALVAMRLVRTGLSLLALLLGKPPVTPQVVVSFVQNKRRKLRALKYRGQKLNRISRAERQHEDELQTTWLSRITLPLRTVVWYRPFGNQPGRVVIEPHRRHNHRHSHNHQNRNQQPQEEQQPGQKRNANQRDESDDSDDEATCSELLNKYEDDAGDSSYQANEASAELSDSSMSELEKSKIADEDASSQPKDEPKKQDESKKQESNGHANKQSKEASSDKKQEKSSLNVESDKSKEEQAKPTENGSVEASQQENKDVKQDKQDKETKQSSSSEQKKPDSKPEVDQNKAGSTGSKTPTAADGGSKPANNQNAASKDRPEENSSKAPASSASDVKSNHQQQKSKQQQHQQQNQHQHQQQHQHNQQPQHQQPHQQHQHQPQHNTSNGGAKKPKRPSHAPAQAHN